VLPALIILLYTGIEQRRLSIEKTKQNLLLITHTMAETQLDLSKSTRQLLSTLAVMPAIRTLDLKTSSNIFQAVLKENTNYQNITLTALNGDVLASGRPMSATSLKDRKHVREALTRKTFAVGEYIISRVGPKVPAFAFACPVFSENGDVIAILTAAIKLVQFSRFHDSSGLPEKSFIAVTDHKGIRLFYYPTQEDTNPVGKPILNRAWETAKGTQEPGFFIGSGSDGIKRIIAFEQVHLTPQEPPYLYVWAGIPEVEILATANAVMSRNLILMLLGTVIVLFIAWAFGRKTLILPIMDLVDLTSNFAGGSLDARSKIGGKSDEVGSLARAFNEMAEVINSGQKILRDSEARFRLIMDSLDAIVYVADMNTYEVLFINAYGKKQLGDITGKICWQSIQKNQTGPCPFCTNKYLLDKNGQPGSIHTWEFQNTVTGHWFYIHDRAIEWVDGRIVRLEVATDITTRKLTESKLAEERERLAVTLASIGDGVITTDTEGKVTLINQVAEQITGWDNGEAIGRPLIEVFHIINEVTRQLCENPVDKVLATGQIIGLANHTALIAKDGTERNIADSGAPIRDKEGNIIGVVLVFRDVTDQLRTEQELVKTKKLESIGVLAGGIAHDFNNILAAILGNLDLSLLDSKISDKTRTLLNEAIKASYRARDLTQQLLTFAKGGQPIKETAVLTEIIKDSAEFVLHGDKVACEYEFPNDLWFVDIDKSQISQVVQNLILNASNAMPNGGTIKVSCESINGNFSGEPAPRGQGNFVRMRIKDSGTGIQTHLLDKIFDPYFTTKQHGSGLGLAITHSIVSKHGGQIFVDSIPGKGSTFIVDLPASAETTIPDKESTEIHLLSRSAKILVMDDEEQVRTITRDMLEALGHDVLLANEGIQAAQIYQKELENGNPPDLVIMDLTVPGGMGGKDAVKEILKINPEAKVIVSSGYSQDPIMANFGDYGFCSALTKPCQLSELARVVDQALN